MAILKFNKGDKVKLTSSGINYVGDQFNDKTFTIKGIVQDRNDAIEHIKECGDENVNSCSCCNYAVVDGYDFYFHIEDGDSEIELVNG